MRSYDVIIPYVHIGRTSVQDNRPTVEEIHNHSNSRPTEVTYFIILDLVNPLPAEDSDDDD